jgi:hypothetical protein
MDFRSSVVHKYQKAFMVGQIVDKPKTARTAAALAAWEGFRLADPAERSDSVSAIAGKVDIIMWAQASAET